MKPIIIQQSRARRFLARYQRIIQSIDYADESSISVQFYCKDGRIFGVRTPPGLIRREDHVPTEVELKTALANLLESDDPSMRYLAKRNLAILSSDQRSLLLPTRERGHPVVNTQRDTQIVRWLAWCDALRIVKRSDDIANHFAISESRLKQIKGLHKTRILFEAADTSIGLLDLLNRSNRLDEKFLTPIGPVILEKDS